MKRLLLSTLCCFSSIAAFAEDEIVITAERREVNLTQTASSISIISNDDVIRINPDHPSEILNTKAGVFLHRGSGQEHLTAIRSPILTGGAGAGSFLYLENNVPLRAAGFANINGLLEAQTGLFERVEIIKGPAGSFYGANAIHGVINTLTPKPTNNQNTGNISFSEYHKKLSASISRENRGEGFYLGLSLDKDTGFRTDSGSDKQTLTFRHTNTSGDWDTDTILTAVNLNQETAGFAQGNNAFKDRALSKTNPNPEAFRDVKSIRLQHELSKKTDKGLISITPYTRWTQMQFLQHFLPSKALEENSHWSIGAQSAYYLDNGVTLGLDSEYTDGYLTEIQSRPTIFSFTQGTHYDFDVQATSLSPFARLTKPIAPQTNLTLAVRGDWTHYDYTNNQPANRVGRFIRPTSGDNEFFTLSPKVSIDHKLDNGLTWISYTQGARPPQVTDLYRLQGNQVIEDIRPERINSFELGWRGQLRENISAEVTSFYAEKENFLFRDADGFNVTDGRTQHIGIEGEIAADITKTLSLSSSATYAKHTYQFDRPVNSTSNATEAITSGDDIDSAPRTLANTRLNWHPQDDFDLEAEWTHVGKYFMDASNTREYSGHDIFNLRAQKHHGFFTSYAIVRNAFNERYATRADFAFGNERHFPDEGRTLTIGLRFKN